MKAVIQVGGKQYIVSKDEVLLVDHFQEDKKQLSFEPLMVFDDKEAKVGMPNVAGATVTAEVLDPEVKGDKIKVIRFESKKRVKTINGYRPRYSRIRITNISV